MRRRLPRTVIPNAVTALCLLFGYCAISATLHGDYVQAAYWSLYAGFLDVADGGLAKLLHATSAAGGVFDSLSDVVTFGVAPAVLIEQVYFASWETAGVLLSAVFVLAAAARLARYTAGQGVGQAGYVAGLPMPLAMGLLAGFVPFSRAVGWGQGPAPVAAVLCVGAACLMISAVPYEQSRQFAARRVPRAWKQYTFVLFVVTVLVAPQVSFFGWSVLFTVGGLVRALMQRQRGWARERVG
jgi:CDP-diacylglycerol--serine O-phosphatidyltransferase